jgi:hypothetical protein
MNYSEKDYRKIGVIAAVAIAIAAMMIPGSNLANIAYASHGSSVKDSGNVDQSTSQSNSISSSNSGSGGKSDASHNTQINSADNSASVHIHNGHHNHHKDSGKYTGSNHDTHRKNGGSIKDSGNVAQSIDQSNSISVSNSGPGGSATANDNVQLNGASNTADVHISNGGHHKDNGGQQTWNGDHKKGGSISDSGNVAQSIDQSNSITATNTGALGSATANDNTQINSASNTANVDIHNHGSGSVDNSGNVAQLITQSNSISATNNPPPPASGVVIACLIGPGIPPCNSASASDNTQINSADNNATVSIGNH